MPSVAVELVGVVDSDAIPVLVEVELFDADGARRSFIDKESIFFAGENGSGGVLTVDIVTNHPTHSGVVLVRGRWADLAESEPFLIERNRLIEGP